MQDFYRPDLFFVTNQRYESMEDANLVEARSI